MLPFLLSVPARDDKPRQKKKWNNIPSNHNFMERSTKMNFQMLDLLDKPSIKTQSTTKPY